MALLSAITSSPLIAQENNQRGGPRQAQTGVARIEPNNNRLPAGNLTDGVLTIHLEIREGQWFPEADSGPSMKIQAFAEEGKPPQIPGPLVRVPQGTEVRATVRNALTSRPAVVHGLHSRPSERAETFEVPAGEVREVRFRLEAPGTYYYWADTTGQPLDVREGADSQLSGTLIVDPPNDKPVNDRVFVIGKWATPHSVGDPRRRVVFVINGKSWPYNERLTHSVGEEVRWRWINPTNRVHPMHLHGFYFRVDSTGDGSRDEIYKPEDRRRAVTERMPIGGTMSVTWVPERQGRWIFHCHILAHFAMDLGLEGPESLPAPHSAHSEIGGDSGMKGLVLGITVLPTNAAEQKSAPPKPRQIRLLVRERPATWDSPKAHVYQLQKGPEEPPIEKATVPGSPIILTRSEPVEITVVNQLKQPTAVHWHGIEIESYYDGVPGWGGYSGEVTPPIESGKSFLVKITPQRAGTFIYHTHWHDPLQLATGLYGPLIVLEPGQTFDPETDKIFIISRGGSDPLRAPVLLNGNTQPDVQHLKKGMKYRLRFINITDNLGSQTVSLLSGPSLVNWRLIAKDGAYVPPNQTVLRPAKQIVAVGETYDFEFQQNEDADLRLEVLRPDNKMRVVAELEVR